MALKYIEFSVGHCYTQSRTCSSTDGRTYMYLVNDLFSTDYFYPLTFDSTSGYFISRASTDLNQFSDSRLQVIRYETAVFYLLERCRSILVC